MFRSNIAGIYGEKGKTWIAELPELVSAISSKLDLRDLKEATNLSYNYVLSGFQGNTHIILKLGLDIEGLARETFALKCFTGSGAVKVLAEDNGMLLLERAMPGTSLKSYFPTKEKESIEIACGVMKKLHQTSVPRAHNFPHIKNWLMVLDKDWAIPEAYLKKAMKLRDRLMQNADPDVLLHGDLHHDNILQNGSDWVVIDPKGVIGERSYEVATFIRNPIPELLNHPEAPNIIYNRVTHFAELLELPSQRILDWYFVQAVLAWAWALEDGCDTSYFQQLTKIFDKMQHHDKQ
jgi:streptomycin 6-kinase